MLTTGTLGTNLAYCQADAARNGLNMRGKQFTKYGLKWTTQDSALIELTCIRRGGFWTEAGQQYGLGLFHHYKELQRALWPQKSWHRWNDLILSEMVRGGILGIMGPASSAKTHEAACYALCVYWAFPNTTTILCSSTTREMLDLRIWGEIKKYWRKAKQIRPSLPGFITESTQSITTDGRDVEGREFRNGIKGVPCKRGGQWQGLGDYVGVKNAIVILIADECQLMQTGFFDSISNLNTNPRFELKALGNPKDPTDPLGVICEPKAGWESIENDSKSKVWETRLWNGRCIQLVGTDSPNYDYPEGAEPFKFLIGRRAIQQAKEYYGENSWQYQMMCLGVIPSGLEARRVITRALCDKFGATEPVVWWNAEQTKLLGIDAAYGAVGGDRCVAIELWMGKDRDGRLVLAMQGAPIIIPVSAKKNELPEDQIVHFVHQYCDQTGIEPGNVFLDGTGRSSLISAFARLWSAAVTPIQFDGRATDRPVRAGSDTPRCNDVYGKFVTELWYMARLAIETQQIKGLTLSVVLEGQMRVWDFVEKGKIDVESKDQTKKRLGRSPDLFDAFVTGIEGARRRGFQIEPLGQKARKLNLDWLIDLRNSYEAVRRQDVLF